MVKVSLFFTTSKTLAYLILIIGSAYSFIFKDSNVLIATFAAASAIIANKTYQESRIEQKKLEFPNSTNDPNPTEKDPEL